MQKNIKQSLSPAFLKQKVEQGEIEKFGKEFSDMLGRVNEKESEEFHKGLIKDFLNKVYYEGKHYINTKDDIDFVIHNTESGKSPVGVVIETKSPTAKTEIINLQKANRVRDSLNIKHPKLKLQLMHYSFQLLANSILWYHKFKMMEIDTSILQHEKIRSLYDKKVSFLRL